MTVLFNKRWLSALFRIIIRYILIMRLIIYTSKPRLSAAAVSTILSHFYLCSSPPYCIKFGAHYLNFTHSSHHIRYLEVCSSLLTEIFGLRAVISLPSLTEWVVHPEIGEIIIFEIEVVEIVTCGLNFLSLEHADQLGLRLFIGDHDFSLLLLLDVGFHLFG